MPTPRAITGTLRRQGDDAPLVGASVTFEAYQLIVDEHATHLPTSVTVTSAALGALSFSLTPGWWRVTLPGARPATFRVPEGVGALTLEALLLGSGAYVPPSQADTFQGMIDAAIAAVEGATLSDAIPQPLGTAAAGDDAEGARGDHIHAMPTAAQVGAATAGDIATHAADTTTVHGIADTSALVLTNDARLSDARTPTAHAATHAGGGADAIALAVAAGAAGLMSGADKTKLDSVAAGATANATDAQLRDRATHTGTQSAATISDFDEAARDAIGATLVAGDNVTITPDDGGDTITIAASGGTPADASTTVKGIVELADTTEAATGTDATRAITPATLPLWRKANGAIQARVDGDPRGAGAVDMQTMGNSDAVAAGEGSGIGPGGWGKLAYGAYSGVGNGGLGLSAFGERSGVGNGGGTNRAYGLYSGVGSGGVDHAAYGSYSGIGSGGKQHVAQGRAAGIHPGGELNGTNADWATASGYYAYAGVPGMRAHANGQFAAQGDAQDATLVLRAQTTNATPAALTVTADAGAAAPAMPNNSIWTMDILVSGMSASGTVALAYRITGLIRRGANAAATAILGTPSVTVIHETDAGADVALAANTTDGGPSVTVTGLGSTTIRWCATVRLVQQIYTP